MSALSKSVRFVLMISFLFHSFIFSGDGGVNGALI